MGAIVTDAERYVSVNKGVSDRILSQTQTTIGIGNAWTIRAVFNTLGHPGYNAGRKWVAIEPPLGNTFNRIRCFIGNFFGPAYATEIYDDAGVLRKSYVFGAFAEQNDWVDFTVTWDGTNLRGYRDAVELSPFKAVDDVVTQQDDSVSRIVAVGSDATGGGSDNQSLAGLYHLVAVWNTALASDEIHEVYQGGQRFFDPKVNRNAYQSANNLRHFWLFGNDITRIGFDYADTASGFRFPNSVGINAADVRHESPYM